MTSRLTELNDKIEEYSKAYDSLVSNQKNRSSDQQSSNNSTESAGIKPIGSFTQEEWDKYYKGYTD